MTAKEELARRLAARMIARREDTVIVPTLAEALTQQVRGGHVRAAVAIVRGPVPEGVEVAVTGDGLTEAEARALAPGVAAAAMPGREWGEAIHCEWHEHDMTVDGSPVKGDWHVVVEDRGPIAGFDGQVH